MANDNKILTEAYSKISEATHDFRHLGQGDRVTRRPPPSKSSPIEALITNLKIDLSNAGSLDMMEIIAAEYVRNAYTLGLQT